MSKPTIKDILREIPDEEFRLIAESKDVAACRERMAAVLSACNPIDPAAPLIHAIADWERENGTVAAIMPEEYEGFCKRIAQAAVRGSARANVSATAPTPVEKVLREAIECALKCTPTIRYLAAVPSATIVYDCGDPWEILREALFDTAARYSNADDPTKGASSLDKLLAEYRPSMNHDILHAWAEDMVHEVPIELGRRDAKLLTTETTYENLMDLHDRMTATLRGYAVEAKNLLGRIVNQIGEAIPADRTLMNYSDEEVSGALDCVPPILRHLDRIIQTGDEALDRVMERVHSKPVAEARRLGLTDIESAAGYLPGASHNAEIKPGAYVAGTTAALDIGYNKDPERYPEGSLDWVNPFINRALSQSKFAVGDHVKINGGPYKGENGTIHKRYPNGNDKPSYWVKLTTSIDKDIQITVVIYETDLQPE